MNPERKMVVILSRSIAKAKNLAIGRSTRSSVPRSLRYGSIAAALRAGSLQCSRQALRNVQNRPFDLYGASEVMNNSFSHKTSPISYRFYTLNYFTTCQHDNVEE
jgi:hypothetical protein